MIFNFSPIVRFYWLMMTIDAMSICQIAFDEQRKRKKETARQMQDFAVSEDGQSPKELMPLLASQYRHAFALMHGTIGHLVQAADSYFKKIKKSSTV